MKIITRHSATDPPSPIRAGHRTRTVRTGLVAGAIVAAVLIAGCGGSNHTQASSPSSDRALTQFLAYTRCMRGHGIKDFPDPTAAGGHFSIQLNGGPGSDLGRNDPALRAAKQACQALEPGGGQAPTPSTGKLGAEMNWARCMRSDGDPGFPDPNGRGVFDRSELNQSSPAFQTASKACASLQAALGPIPVG